jgi:transcriptional regulator with XRE-family HTH domain
MRVVTPSEIARAAKAKRMRLGWTQTALAARIGATRQWVITFERGSARLELGLALRALTALGLGIDVVPVDEPRTDELTVTAKPLGDRQASRIPTRHADPALLFAPPAGGATGHFRTSGGARPPRDIVRMGRRADPHDIVDAHLAPIKQATRAPSPSAAQAPSPPRSTSRKS